MLGSQIPVLSPGSIYVCLVTLGKLVHFSVPSSQTAGLGWRLEAHSLLSETQGQREFRFQNLLFYEGNVSRVPHVS